MRLTREQWLDAAIVGAGIGIAYVVTIMAALAGC